MPWSKSNAGRPAKSSHVEELSSSMLSAQLEHTFEPFVTAEPVAEFLSSSPAKVLAMARSGELPAHPLDPKRIRKQWRFRMSEIYAYYSARKSTTTPSKPATTTGDKVAPGSPPVSGKRA